MLQNALKYASMFKSDYQLVIELKMNLHFFYHMLQ